jgi:hypothetical protein
VRVQEPGGERRFVGHYNPRVGRASLGVLSVGVAVSLVGCENLHLSRQDVP